MVNDLRLSGSWYSALFGPPNLAASLATFPTTWTFADGDYNNLGGANNVYPQGRNVGQWQIIDDFSYVRGKHEFKVGLNYRYNYVSTYAYGPNISGLLTFNDMNAFVAGNLSDGSTFSQAFATIGAEPLRLYSAGFYGQDTWRVNSRLTATLAARFDRNSNISCKFNCFSELAGPFAGVDHTAATPYNSAIKTGIGQAFPSLEKGVFAPRVGIAYTVTKSTVIRGGFGIFSDLYQGLIADRLLRTRRKSRPSQPAPVPRPTVAAVPPKPTWPTPSPPFRKVLPPAPPTPSWLRAFPVSADPPSIPSPAS